MNTTKTITKYFSNNYLVFSTHSEDLFRIIQEIKLTKLWNANQSPRGKFLIVLFKDFTEHKLLKYFWKMDVTKVILLKMLKNNMKLFTWNPFDVRNLCGYYVTNKIVTDCEKLYKINFQDDLDNLENCNLSASVIYNKVPYVNVPVGTKRSLFIEPLRIISAKRNFNITFHTFDEFEIKDYFKKGNINTTISYINARKRDIYVAVHNHFSYYDEYLEVTDIFFYEAHFWIIAKPDLINNVKIFIKIFKPELWISISFLYCSLTVLVYFKRPKNNNAFLIVFALTLSMSTNISKCKPRLFVINYVFYSLLICYCFYAKLSSMLTKPIEEKGISNFLELIESDAVPLLTQQKRISLNNIDHPHAKKLFRQSKKSDLKFDENKFNFLLSHKEYVSDSYENDLDINRAMKKNIRIIGNNFLLPMQLSYALRQGHPLIPLFNKFAGNIFEAGLYQYWLTDWEITSDEKKEKSFQTLSIEHIYGALIEIICGLTVSFIIFMIELLTELCVN